MKKVIKIKELWRKGNDLHVVTKKNKHIVFHDISLVGIDQKLPKMKGMEVHEVLINALNKPTKYTYEIMNEDKELMKQIMEQC